MLIDHDVRYSLDLVVDLLNSAPDGLADELADVAGLRAFVARHRISDVAVDTLEASDAADVRRVRDRFAEVFAASTEHEAAELINTLVAAAGTTPRLTDHDGHAWHVHYFAPGASIADHLAADCGMALGFFVVAGERERLRRCEAPDCGRAFVDLSRNRSRRYCSNRTCGNRLHAAAYRARRRDAEESVRRGSPGSQEELVVHPREE
ncbi:CGNR zinc finger domain-containing protein [Streptomyces hainanensis]|uniref:Zf-CGNR multi-domain protein n=1 Tax=Streptomyces hainanensis TaxID=402648 RepID=A0A4V2Y319_9ACTN|nr:CGNR zinc finger domain-containing protein [Streptomyces hainanensis]TDC74745.1 zf-CGNR multi-domain protein [Streptomyces hainanensis]